MKIVMLERKNVGTDFPMPDFEKFGELTVYDYSTPDVVAARVKDADIVIMNKMPMNEETLRDAANLKLISGNSPDAVFTDMQSVTLPVGAQWLFSSCVTA